MGCCQTFSVFTEEELTTYQCFTNLNRAEIIQMFQEIEPKAFEFSKMGKISLVTVAETLPELATSLATKLPLAFQIFDFNGDDALCGEDLGKMVDYLTRGRMRRKDKRRIVKNASTKYDRKVIGNNRNKQGRVLKETDMDGDGVMSYPEFERVITLYAAPDFMKHFKFIL